METYHGSVYIEHGGQPLWIITLDKYERDNLLLLINAIGYGSGSKEYPWGIEPFKLFNSGDWVGQIGCKLAKPIYSKKYGVPIVETTTIAIDENDRPNNLSLEAVAEQVKNWLSRKGNN